MSIEEVIEGLSNIPGMRTYTDKDGKFHITNISETEEEKRKLEVLGTECPICKIRSHDFKTTPNGVSMCIPCYNKRWEDKRWIFGELVSAKVKCPFCHIEFIAKTEGMCNNCGALYHGRVDYDEGINYNFRRKK